MIRATLGGKKPAAAGGLGCLEDLGRLGGMAGDLSTEECTKLLPETLAAPTTVPVPLAFPVATDLC